jgi:hypothetical protein
MRFHGVLLGNQHEIWSKQHNGKVRIYPTVFLLTLNPSEKRPMGQSDQNREGDYPITSGKRPRASDYVLSSEDVSLMSGIRPSFWTLPIMRGNNA